MTDARTTQVSVEHWAQPNAQARVTQVGIEHWASAGTATVRALLTQTALEHWAVVPATLTVRPRRAQNVLRR